MGALEQSKSATQEGIPCTNRIADGDARLCHHALLVLLLLSVGFRHFDQHRPVERFAVFALRWWLLQLSKAEHVEKQRCHLHGNAQEWGTATPSTGHWGEAGTRWEREIGVDCELACLSRGSIDAYRHKNAELA